MSRSTKICPLCPPAIEQAEHDAIWYHYQETMDYDAAAAQAAQMGLDISAGDITAHLKNHRWVQPAPKGNLRRGPALEKVAALPNERLRTILRLLARVRALSATQIAEAVYFTGDERKWHSQRNQCYRDLRRLLYSDLVYRWAPDGNRPAGNMRRVRQDQMLLYFLGRDAVPYVEERESATLARRDWITRPDQLGDSFEVLLAHERAELVATLRREMQSAQRDGALLDILGGCRLTFDPLNWWGAPRTTLYFDEPVSGVSSVSAGGLAAFGIELPARKLSVLAPFFYEYDAGVRNAGRYADQLLGYLALSRTNAVNERYPDLPLGFMPRVLVVCRDARRVPAVQHEAQQRAIRARLGDEPLPAVAITDEASFQAHGLHRPCWLSLWDSDPVGSRRGLVEVLLRGSMPLLREAQHLTAASQLLCDPAGAPRRST